MSDRDIPSKDVAEPTVSEQRAVLNNPAGAVATIKRQQAEIAQLKYDLEMADGPSGPPQVETPAEPVVKGTYACPICGRGTPHTHADQLAPLTDVQCKDISNQAHVCEGVDWWPSVYAVREIDRIIQHARGAVKTSPKPPCRDCDYYRSTGLETCSTCGSVFAQCPECKTALAFDGDVCGLCHPEVKL